MIHKFNLNIKLKLDYLFHFVSVRRLSNCTISATLFRFRDHFRNIQSQIFHSVWRKPPHSSCCCTWRSCTRWPAGRSLWGDQVELWDLASRPISIVEASSFVRKTADLRCQISKSIRTDLPAHWSGHKIGKPRGNQDPSGAGRRGGCWQLLFLKS